MTVPDIGHTWGSQTYTTPRFEDTSIIGAKNKAHDKLKESEELIEQAQKVNERASAWIDLLEELRDQGLTKVSQLPEDRQRYWKLKLEERITTYL